jgi:hypothetical protein
LINFVKPFGRITLNHYFWGMKRIMTTILALCFLTIGSMAQEVTTMGQDAQTTVNAPTMEPMDDTEGTEGLQSFFEPLSPEEIYFADFQDTLHLPRMNHRGQVMPIGHYPYYWGGWWGWDLHEGLNVTVGASVMAQFGKHARSGAGFGQNIAMVYALPLSKRLTLAVGGYFNRLSWSHDAYHDAGVTAVLGYRFDEHWEAYIYGQKSITHSKYMPMPFYGMGMMGDRLGAAVRYNFSPSMSVEVSVETDRLPQTEYYDARRGMPPPLR